jgi:signal transduction histidine kinase
MQRVASAEAPWLSRGLTPGGGIAWFPAPSGAERWIALARGVLAVTSLVAILLDPEQQAGWPSSTHVTLIGYFAYAAVLFIVAWTPLALRLPYQLVTHAVDLAVLTALVHDVRGPASPFFPYYTFALVVAAIRWQRVGAVATVAAALLLYSGAVIEGELIRHQGAFELHRFLIRVAYLSVAAVLVGHLSSLEANARAKLALLARWPARSSDELQDGLRISLDHAARVLGVTRLILVWQEAEEPLVHTATWTSANVEHETERRGEPSGLVAEAPGLGSFLCSDADQIAPRLWRRHEGEVRQWRGRPLDEEFRRRHGIRRVLGARLPDEDRPGFLLALDGTRWTFDDLFLVEIVAAQVAARLRDLALSHQSRQVAVSEERLAFARDLHDGLLQSLMGIALQVAAARELLRQDPELAEERLRRVQDLVREEQRELRELIQELRPEARSAVPTRPLAERLESLADIERGIWGIEVHLSVSGTPQAFLEHEVYWIVREALSNVARHSDASSVCVGIAERNGGALAVEIADNGRGLPIQGRYDAQALERLGAGPITLRERIQRLGGSLVVDSGPSGTRLEIELPGMPAGTYA